MVAAMSSAVKRADPGAMAAVALAVAALQRQAALLRQVVLTAEPAASMA